MKQLKPGWRQLYYILSIPLFLSIKILKTVQQRYHCFSHGAIDLSAGIISFALFPINTIACSMIYAKCKDPKNGRADASLKAKMN